MAIALAVAALAVTAGCATTGPDGGEGNTAAAGEAGGEGPMLPAERKDNYAFEIKAPDEFVDEIKRRTLVGRWQRRRDYDPIQFEGLVARLQEEVQALLRAEGYYRAKVSVVSAPERVSVDVQPGARVKVGSVAFRISGPGNGDPLLADVRGIPDLEAGQPFRTGAWQDGKRRVVDALNRRGYLRADIARSEAQVDVEAGTAALELEVASGSRVAFGELQVEGLSRYDRKIIDDIRTFLPGEPYSAAKLESFQARLRTAGYFSSSSALPDLVALQKDPAADRVAIQVIVTELERRRVVFGVGYSTDEGPRGQVGFEHRDLLGTGLRLESALVMSAKRQRAFANFRTPYDADNRFIGFGQRLEREDIEGQVTLRSNTYAGFGHREDDIESFTSLQYQVERETIPAGANGPGERNSQQALVLGYAWNLRRLDFQLAPTRGYAITAQISGARKGLLTDRSFVRLYTRATRFQPLPADGAFRNGMLIGILEIGYVVAGSREDIPSENLFRAGGVQSLRGYAYQSLGVPKGGAIVGGRYLAIGSLEYQHRVTETYSAAAFVDYGNAGDSRSNFDPVAGYGVGLRARTPIGPINLDVAYGQAVSRYRIHFSIGYTF
ncbi:MAG: autotransporter assembly complex family protein [Lautropia sp.]